MRKTISILLIIMIIFSTLVVPPVQATPESSASAQLESQPVEGKVNGQGAFQQHKDLGSVPTGANAQTRTKGWNYETAKAQTAKTDALNSDQDSYIARIFAWFIELIAGVISYPINWVMTKLTGQEDASFQIEKVVFNEYKIFDLDFFKNTDANAGGVFNDFMIKVRDAIAGWYYGMRVLAIMVSLAVLIYIAIRMAISTLATEKAKYKKMLKSWLVSLFILFTLHYVIIIMVYLSDILVDMLKNVKGNIGIEASVKNTLLTSDYKGWEALARAIMLFTFTYLQVKFFVIYFKRMIVAAFLITISPLITITYSIDKVADNQAQAFQNWIREMITVVFMQPMHALLFIIFAFSASEIMKFAPFIAVLVLWAISKGETVLRRILNLQSSSAVGSLQDTKILGKIVA